MGILLHILGAAFVMRLVYEILRRAIGGGTAATGGEPVEDDSENSGSSVRGRIAPGHADQR